MINEMSISLEHIILNAFLYCKYFNEGYICSNPSNDTKVCHFKTCPLTVSELYSVIRREEADADFKKK